MHLVAEVLHLFQSVKRGQPVREFEEVFAVENKGFENCTHGRHGSRRQVLLMDAETLEQFRIPAGRVKENVTTRGIALQKLLLGQRILVGEALLEVTLPCAPCHQMDEIRQGLQEALCGRRGTLCRVIGSGRIRRGDHIEIVREAGDGESKSQAQEHVG
jgi:MOSC domain-containing protein YiiM